MALPLLCHDLWAQAPATASLRVAAAADLQPVLPPLIALYQQHRDAHINATFGSSATLTQQIQNGAPVDLFLSADCAHPQQLANLHLTTDAAPTPYASGVLVLWARKDSPAQPLSLESLAKASVNHVAVANERHAPYGQAAMAELAALDLLPSLSSKLVLGENILQTAQFADTGNAQAALISLTIASSPHFRETGTYVVLPRRYPAIVQCGVVLRTAANPEAARDFLHWIASPEIQSRLPQFGLEPAH